MSTRRSVVCPESGTSPYRYEISKTFVDKDGRTCAKCLCCGREFRLRKGSKFAALPTIFPRHLRYADN